MIVSMSAKAGSWCESRSATRSCPCSSVLQCIWIRLAANVDEPNMNVSFAEPGVSSGGIANAHECCVSRNLCTGHHLADLCGLVLPCQHHPQWNSVPIITISQRPSFNFDVEAEFPWTIFSIPSSTRWREPCRRWDPSDLASARAAEHLLISQLPQYESRNSLLIQDIAIPDRPVSACIFARVYRRPSAGTPCLR